MSPKQPAGTESGLFENNNRNFQLRDLLHFMFSIDPSTGVASLRTTTLSGTGISNFRTPFNGRQTSSTPGTPQAISALSIAFEKCSVQALESNDGAIVLGGLTVTAASSARSGYALYPANSYPFDEPGNLQDILFDIENSGDGVSFIYTQ